jgi:hypothetical protein
MACLARAPFQHHSRVLPFLPFFLPSLPFAHEEKKRQLPSNGRKSQKRQPSAAAPFPLNSRMEDVFFAWRTWRLGGSNHSSAAVAMKTLITAAAISLSIVETG